MNFVYTIVFTIFFSFKVFALGIFELYALSVTGPILYEQYFDNSLEEKSIYAKKNGVLMKSKPKIKFKNNKLDVKSNADLIYYLSISEQMNLIRENY